MQLDDFYLNSHCLVTDLSSLDLYSLDIDEFSGHLARRFQNEAITVTNVSELLYQASLASLLRWHRMSIVPETNLADIEKSLSLETSSVRVNLENWIDRSRAAGGVKDQWDALLEVAKTIDRSAVRDPRRHIAIHLLDEIFRYWMKSAFGVRLERHWVEDHLRGLATFEALAAHDFFIAIADYCTAQQGPP